jgi:RHS repeat-associated protein
MRLIESFPIFTLALAIGTSAFAGSYTIEMDRSSNCQELPDPHTADEACAAFGLGSYNPSGGYCNSAVAGKLAFPQTCQNCAAGAKRVVHNFQWKCQCEEGKDYDELAGACVPLVADPSDCATAGNPIDFGTGEKRVAHTDFIGSGPFPLRLERYYNSRRNLEQRIANLSEQEGAGLIIPRQPELNPVSGQLFPTFNGPHIYRFMDELFRPDSPHAAIQNNLAERGVPQWRHNYAVRLLEYPADYYNEPTLMLVRANGVDARLRLAGNGIAFQSVDGSEGHAKRMSLLAGDPFDGLRLFRGDGIIEDYAAGDGRLLRIQNPLGHEQVLGYTDDENRLLSHVEDDFGNRLIFAYDDSYRLASVSAAYNASSTGGEDYQVFYTVTYTYLDDTNLFETVSYPGAANPVTYLYEDSNFSRALTGYLDENGDRRGTYTYRDTGLAETTETGTAGNINAIAYTRSSRTVTNPLGKDTVYHFDTQNKRQRIAAIEGVPTASCLGSNSVSSYDAGGFRDAVTDSRGTVTQYQHNERGLESARTEAVGTPEQRTITTEWHPDYALETRVETALLLTSLNYGDGGLLGSRVETDKSGFASGSRTWTYTYYTSGLADGLLHTVDGPRTDVADTTSYEYNNRGLISRITNALGHVTAIDAYDPWGNPTSITNANGVTTTLTYTARGWLDTVTVDTRATTDYDYDDAGQLVAATLPNGARTLYSYNDAGQLQEISNRMGERMTFTLDAMGNITGISIRDDNGTLMLQQAQVFDELSRLRNEMGSNGQDYGHHYDLANNRNQSDDALGNTTQRVFDSLNRLTSVTDALGGVLRYVYDAHDNIVSVEDQEGVFTTFGYDGFDQLKETVSPNTGVSTYVHDAAGNRTRQIDARGVVSEYAYDALDRLTAVSFPGEPALNVAYSYDDTQNGNSGIGLLTSIQDHSGLTRYAYNRLGHLTGKRVVIDDIDYQWNMSHDRAGLLTAMTYPSGRTVRYERDGEGRVNAVYTRATASEAEEAVATGFTYQPFGPVSAYQFGNALRTTNSYDKDYRISKIAVSDSLAVLNRLYSHDVTDNINAILNGVDASKDQAFDYDPLYRLKTATGSYGSIDYELDGTGNRVSKIRMDRAGATIESYTTEAGSQRLLAVDTTVNGATEGTRSFVYDANGNPASMTAADGRLLEYAYGANNRPASVSEQGQLLANYVFNGLGQRRIKALADGTTTHFHYAGNGQLLAETDENGYMLREYLYADGMRLAMVVDGNTLGSAQRQCSKTRDGWIESAQDPEGLPWPVNAVSVGSLDLNQEQALALLSQRPGRDIFLPLAQYLVAAKLNLLVDDEPTEWFATVSTLVSDVDEFFLEYPLSMRIRGGLLSFRGARADVATHIRTREYADELAASYVGEALCEERGPSQGQLVFFHNDHLGTPQLMTNQDQQTVWQGDYLPFGDVSPHIAQVENPIRFPGQYFDGESGTYYNYFRDYDVGVGRYLQSDPIGLNGGLNTYGYVGGNPLIYTDPYGLANGDVTGPDSWLSYNTGDASAFSASTNNARYNACVSQCVIRKLTPTLEICGNTAGVIGLGLGAQTSAAAGLSCATGAVFGSTASCSYECEKIEDENSCRAQN